MQHEDDLSQIKEKYSIFLSSLEIDNNFKFTKKSNICIFSLCFAIYGFNLLNKRELINKNKDIWNQRLLQNLDRYYKERKLISKNIFLDKSFLQLLCFSLSAFKILNTLEKNIFLKNFFDEFYKLDLLNILKTNKVFEGFPKTGNLSMFYSIIYFYIIKFKNYSDNSFLDNWHQEHLKNMNEFGFWGKNKKITYLNFQNGYHQYEIFKYFKFDSIKTDLIKRNLSKIIDFQGHFAPYIGGGGCYDYDAINLLTTKTFYKKNLIETNIKELLLLSMNSIILNQNIDGGFSESKYVRPINYNYFKFFIRKILNSNSIDRIAILRQFFTLMRPKYNSITTHWNNYSRGWSESNIWDSWFRMQSLARIDIYLNYEKFSNWGFIDFPGIGFHEYLKK